MTKKSHLERLFSLNSLKEAGSFRDILRFSWETFQKLTGLAIIKEIAIVKGEKQTVVEEPILSEDLSFLSILNTSQFSEFRRMLTVESSSLIDKPTFELEIDCKSTALEKAITKMIFARQCFSFEQFTSLYKNDVPEYIEKISKQKKTEVFDNSALRQILQKFIWLGLDAQGNKHFFIMPEVGYFIGSDGNDFDISSLVKIAPAHPAELILNQELVENLYPILLDYEIFLAPIQVLHKDLLQINKARQVIKKFDPLLFTSFMQKSYIDLVVPQNDIIERIYISFSRVERSKYTSYEIRLNIDLEKNFYKKEFRSYLFTNKLKILRTIYLFFLGSGYSHQKDIKIDSDSLDLCYGSKNAEAAFVIYDSETGCELVLYRAYVDKNEAEINAQAGFDNPNASVFLLNDFVLFANIIYDRILRLDEEEEA